MGVATTRPMDRVAAAMGELEKADILVQSADDIPNGGALCALPALLAIGLLRHAESHFTFPPGYYPMEFIFLLLAYLALGRVPSLEQLRYQAPGEWGKLLGLERIPEVKTLREKTSLLGDDETRKGETLAQLQQQQTTLDALKTQRKATPHHIELKDLPPENAYSPKRWVKFLPALSVKSAKIRVISGKFRNDRLCHFPF